MREVDTITLGAGGGAYPAAFALARAGQDVVMADSKGVMSGNCLAEGCVPSKAVFEVAELRRRLRLAPRGKALGTLSAPPDYLVAGIESEAQRFHWRSGELPMIACFPCRGGRAHQRHLNLPSRRFGHQRWYGGRR